MFGYGSLMWRPDFAYVEKTPARIEGYSRRFWQASPDHRGTPEAPGRVVTLTKDVAGFTDGFVYQVQSEVWAEVLAVLDLREQAGFEQIEIQATVADSGVVNALTYFANSNNPHFLGAASTDVMVEQILHCVGPSGPNRDYLLNLAGTLRQYGLNDEHVFELEAALLERLNGERIGEHE
ncbi:MAG: gamma-glutamylcyclotransferase [Pseudomonadota bacterium]